MSTYYLDRYGYNDTDAREFTTLPYSRISYGVRSLSDTIKVELVDHASGGDYSNSCSVEISNFRYLEKLFEESDEYDGHAWTLTGDMGSYGIAIDADWLKNSESDAATELRELLASLEEYPVLDDELHLEVEEERRDEAWSGYICQDFIKELVACKHLTEEQEDILDDVDEVDMRAFFEKAVEEAGEYWEDHADGPWIDVDGIAKSVSLDDLDELMKK